MRKHGIAHGITLIIPLLIAITAIVGHAIKAPYLASLSADGLVTMKPATALAFIAACLMTWEDKAKRHAAVFIVALASLACLGYWVETEESFTVGKGVPSLVTVACFYSLCVSAVWRRSFAFPPILLGLTALAGYALGFPAMYYYVNVSTAMSVGAAISFICLGLAATVRD